MKEQADSAPARRGEREPCAACGGSKYVRVVLRNDQAHTDQVLTQTCTACLPGPGAAGRAGLGLPGAAGLLLPQLAWCASGGAAVVLSLWLRGAAAVLGWLAVTAVVFLATVADCRAAARRARKAGLR